MEVSRPRIPVTLLIVIAVLLVLGFVAGRYINATMTEEQLAAANPEDPDWFTPNAADLEPVGV